MNERRREVERKKERKVREKLGNLEAATEVRICLAGIFVLRDAPSSSSFLSARPPVRSRAWVFSQRATTLRKIRPR